MNYPSIKTLTSRLNIDSATAKIVRGLMKGDVEPDTIPATKDWIDECFIRPFDDELIMHAIDAVLENFGIKSMGENLGSFYRFASQYSYSNPGDNYAGTVILDNETGRFIICGWADIAGKLANRDYMTDNDLLILLNLSTPCEARKDDRLSAEIMLARTKAKLRGATPAEVQRHVAMYETD